MDPVLVLGLNKLHIGSGLPVFIFVGSGPGSGFG